MLRKLILAAAVASSVLAGGVAFAQAAPPSSSPAARNDAPPPPRGQRPPRPRGMMRADTNGDGVVTRQEAIAQATRKFDKLDRNRDGKLTAAEMPQRGQRGGRRGQRGGGDMQSPPPSGNGY